MRIFFFITKSEQGGAQTHVAQLTEFFVSRGDHVAVMSAPGGWLETESKRLGAEFFPNPHLDNTLNPSHLWSVHKAFLNAVTKFNPDLVACHSTVAGLIGRFSLKHRLPTVFTAHGWGFTQGSPLLRRLILPFFERVAAFYTDKIICVSQNDVELAKHHQIISTKKLLRIYNGVPVPDSLHEQSNDKIFTHLIFVGRLASPKEPTRLLEAFLELPIKDRQRSHITIVGSGPMKKTLMRFIKDHQLEKYVDLIGNVPHAEIAQHLEQADIFVLPTRWEGFPYTLLEAMASGLPIITTNVGGIPEAIDGAGILVPPSDTHALSEALRVLIENPIQRNSLGKAGRKRVQLQFSQQKMCEETLHVYESILK